MVKAVNKYNLLRPLGSTQRPVALTEAATLKGDFPWAFQTVDAAPGLSCMAVCCGSGILCLLWLGIVLKLCVVMWGLGCSQRRM
jgi:hypothetical protein